MPIGIPPPMKLGFIPPIGMPIGICIGMGIIIGIIGMPPWAGMPFIMGIDIAFIGFIVFSGPAGAARFDDSDAGPR